MRILEKYFTDSEVYEAQKILSEARESNECLDYLMREMRQKISKLQRQNREYQSLISNIEDEIEKIK